MTKYNITELLGHSKKMSNVIKQRKDMNDEKETILNDDERQVDC